MTSARDAILRRVRAALNDVPANETPGEVRVSRTYHTHDGAPAGEIVARFVERVTEYKAVVRLVAEAELPAAIAAELEKRGVRRLAVPADAPEAWLPAGVETLRDQGQLAHAELDRCDGVLSGCALGIAQTGTIVLDHGALQGRRAISLLPDYHLCLVGVEQIVGSVPEAMTRLADAAAQGRPLTFISGPSATSDIELNRVEGVHGPRTLVVLVVER